MKPITGVVHDGHVIPEGRLDWPNGTRVDISPHQETPGKFGLDESEWKDDAASCADWEAWIQTIEPPELTPEEQTAIDQFRQQMRRLNVEAVRRQMEEGAP